MHAIDIDALDLEFGIEPLEDAAAPGPAGWFIGGVGLGMELFLLLEKVFL